MNNFDIVSVFECFFVNENGEKVKYYRAVVHEYGVDKDLVTVDKCTGGFYEKFKDVCPLSCCVPLYDRGGRITSVNTDIFS